MRIRVAITALFILAATATLPAQVPPGLPAADTAPAAPAADAARRVDPFERTKSQIDLLLARRLTPPEFDPTRYNPFTIGPAGGMITPDPKTPDEPVPAANNETLLRQLAPRVRVTGYFAREGLSFAVVDGVPRREGDFIILNHQGGPVNLRVKRVEDGRLTLGLGEAEYTLRF